MLERPPNWRAAVAWVGVSDLHKLYAKSMEHFKYYFREQMGDMVHGVNDPRCPVEQSQVFRDRLIELAAKRARTSSTSLGDEGHGSTDIAQKIRTFNNLADYLERVL